MGLLTGKKLVITGISSNRSIAYGIARACYNEGAELILTYNDERFKSRLDRFAGEFGNAAVYELDVVSDDSIADATAKIAEHWPEGFDGFLHSIAFAPREAIEGKFLDGLSRKSFLTAIEISSYSYAALAKAFLPLMQGHKASILTLSYLGAEKVVPNYNTMGVAKAAWKQRHGISLLILVRWVSAPMLFPVDRFERWLQVVSKTLRRCSRSQNRSAPCASLCLWKTSAIRPHSSSRTMRQVSRLKRFMWMLDSMLLAVHSQKKKRILTAPHPNY